MKSITYSAPAKVILSGEHAVVYGKPAFVAAINLRLQVTVHEGESSRTGILGEIINEVKRYMKAKGQPFSDRACRLEVVSAIPVGRGLGSSAALSVAASAGLLEFFTGREPEQETVNNCAYTVEKLFHANPSGVDTTASCYGGLIFYRREFDFLKTISKLSMQIPKAFASRLWLVDSGKPEESTAEMVGMVGKRYNRNAKKTDGVLSCIEKSTKRFVVACMAEDEMLLRQSITENGKALGELGVVSAPTEKLISDLSILGTGKVTGAGGKKKGSGFLLFFAHDTSDVRPFFDRNKIPYLPFSPSLVGMKKEL